MDGQERSARDRRQTDGGAVTSLASQALSVLATRRSSRDDRTTEALTARLEAAVVDSDPDRRVRVLAELRTLGMSDAQIADDLIPAVARRLGAAWCEDGKSFAEVTIGTARLQAMVRDLAPGGSDAVAPRAPFLAVVLRADEHHTLGAVVLTAQLRRIGIAVRLCLGESDAAVLAALSAERFDAVLISAAQGENLVNLADFVEKVRQVVTEATPIVVGGSAVARGLAVRERIGADCVTADLREALDACNLTISHTVEEGRRQSNEALAPT